MAAGADGDAPRGQACVGDPMGVAASSAMIALHDVDGSRAELPALTTHAQSRYDPPRWTRDPAL